MEPINWGIIGCGDVTEVKSGPAFNNVPGSALVAVMRRDAGKAADYARRHNVPTWYTDADALINDPAVNAVYIATPPDSHADYTIRALRAGKPVYVEKPMALNAVECGAMNRISRETGVPLFVAFYRRALPYFLKVKELVDGGVIGPIRHVSCQLNWPPADRELGLATQANWRVTPAISGGGLFHDLAAHQFDFLEFLLGPIQTARGFAHNQAGLYEADDMVVAAFTFASGVMGTGSWCFTVNPEQRLEQTTLVGARGTLTFSFFENFVITLNTRAGTETLTVPFPDHVQQPLIESVVAALQGRGTCPSTGETGLRASLILDWITAG
ncbi:Gfo/Idh/MocA family protein [Fibrella sp. WM1]|uniref:Gfo/Idh/MocA family protein n=1 Tax=Fibrella musci TaxID=3242485 RepID=UPI003522AEA2